MGLEWGPVWLRSSEFRLRKRLPWQRFSRLAQKVATPLWREAVGFDGKAVLVLWSPGRTMAFERGGYLSVAVRFFDGRIRQCLQIGLGLSWYGNGRTDEIVDSLAAGRTLAGLLIGMSILAKGLDNESVAVNSCLRFIGCIDDSVPIRRQDPWERDMLTLVALFDRDDPPRLDSLCAAELGELYESVQDERIAMSEYDAKAEAAGTRLRGEIRRILSRAGL